MTDPSKSSGTQSQSGSHPMGADQAKAYVPPQVLKSKPKGQVHGAKVEIKAEADPRRAKTEVRLGVPPQAVGAAQGMPRTRGPGTAPALQTPPEVLPFKKNLTPPGGVNVDGALPFKPAGAGAGAAAAAAPSNGVEYPSGPKSPPLKLMSPGELLPLSAPFGGAAAAHGSGAGNGAAAAAPAAAAAAVVSPAVASPQAVPDVSATPPPVVVDTDEAQAGGAPPGDAAAGGEPAARSPWGSSPPNIQDESSGEADKKEEGEQPLGAADSPWSSTHSVDVEALPSSAMLSPSAGPSEPAPAPVPAEEPKRSSAGMTIGLALAAVALVGALAYFILAKDGGSSDPAEVKVGTEQQDYKPAPVPTGKPTTSAVAKPKPVYKPPPKPAGTPRKIVPKPRPKPVDIYEDF